MSDIFNNTPALCEQLSISVCRAKSAFNQSPFSRLFRARNSCHCFCVELVKPLPVRRYSADIGQGVLLKNVEAWANDKVCC